MKRIIFSTLIATLLISSCQKNDLNESKLSGDKVPDYALVKFVNSYTALTPSLAVPATGPNVDFYINSVKMNGAAVGASGPVGPGISYGGLFPNIGGAFNQAPSGVVNIKVVLNRTAGGGLPTDTIASNNFTLGPNVAHSVILVDPFPNPTPFNPTLMVIQESVSMPAYGKAKIRLLNLIVSTDLYELYNTTTSAVISAGIPFKNTSDWIEVPLTAATYAIRKVGTTTNTATVAITPGNQRSYTIYARGNTAVTGRAITLSSYITQ